MSIAANEILRGKVEYATVIENKKGQHQLELKVVASELLVGSKPEDGVENVPSQEHLVYLHVDAEGDNAEGGRQAMARDQISRITGVELEMDWASPSGWLRLLEDHPESIIPKIEGQDVMIKGVESKDGTKVFVNLYWPRSKPKALTVAEVKKKFQPY